MLPPDALKLLLDSDDSDSLEAPVGFDRVQAEHEVLASEPSLNRLLQGEVQVMTGTVIQDAAFFAEILLPKFLWKEDPLMLRFSAFGRMVALNEEEDLAPEVLTSLVDFLEARNWCYIPSAVLWQGKSSWWRRYFDYL